MKNLNKVLAMLVVFMMVVSTVAFAANFSDVAATSNYSTPINVDADLGLITGYTDGTFKPEGEITRAEFAAIVVRLLGQEAQASAAAASTAFADVPATHWAAGYINIATQAGIIKGYGNGMFGPDALVNYEDAITMIVRALGYEPAIGAAGYPTGYLTKAGELGITDGVNGINGVPANRGTVATIAFNALDVPVMQQTGYGTFTQFIPQDGTNDTDKKTVLSENHSVVLVEAVINFTTPKATDTGYDTVNYTITNALNNRLLPQRVVVEDGETSIVPETAKIGDSNIADFVGKKVMLFVKINKFSENEIVSAYESFDAQTLSIKIADYISYDEGNGKLSYFDANGNKRSVTFAGPIYNNGKYDELNTFDDVEGKPGTIELSLFGTSTAVDYDRAYITAYDAFVVDEVDEYSMTVSSYTDVDYDICFDDEDLNVKATLKSATGADMKWTDLKEYDVLMVKYVENNGVEYFDAYVVENTVSGKVAGIYDGMVTIDGVDYDATEEALEEITLRSEGTFYLDENDTIVYFNGELVKSDNYGYIVDAYDFNDRDFYVTLLDKEGNTADYKLANRVTLVLGEDNTDVVDKDEVFEEVFGDGFDTFDVEDDAMLVTYRLSDGKIAEIDVTLTSDDADIALYRADKGRLGSFDIDETTVIFAIGADAVEESAVISLDKLQDDAKYYTVVGYDPDEDSDILGAVVIKYNVANVFGAANEFATFIVSCGETLSDDGEEVYIVKGYAGLKPVSYTVDFDATSAIGTLVYPLFKVDGTVSAFADADDDLGDEYDIVTGALEAVNTKKDFIEVDGYVDGNDENESIRINSDVNVYVFDAQASEELEKPIFEVNAGMYFRYDEDADTFNVGRDKLDCDVTVTLYVVDGDVVDVLYVLNSYDER